MRWSIHFSEQQQQKCLIFVTICYFSQNGTYQTKQQTKFVGISVTLSCKELSFRQNDYSVSRGEWMWWYWNCLQILWHISLKFPPIKYVLASATDFYWTESGETDFCSVGKPTLSISYYAAKTLRPHAEHLDSTPTDSPQLMPHPKAISNCQTCAWTNLQMTLVPTFMISQLRPTGKETCWPHSLSLAPTQMFEQSKCCFEPLGFDMVYYTICWQ